MSGIPRHFFHLTTLLLATSTFGQPSSQSHSPVHFYDALLPRADLHVSVEYTDDSAFQRAVLNSTNTYRRQHSASAVEWNESLAEYAGEWSAGCVFEHSGGHSGENLASGYPSTTASHDAWGHEREDYDFDKATFTKQTGHFTQLVWKSTTSVGCGRTLCNGRDGGGAPGWYIVCEYYPPGNVLGRFKENVQERVRDEPEDPEEENPEEEGPDGPEEEGPDEEEDEPDECPQGAICPEEDDDCPQGAVCSVGARVRGWRWLAAISLTVIFVVDS
ncbi:PR-1-like protein [Lojkania enalia]|uniref:PR-1-like protein n=1 Tax=Lojkania enalia TaxID=147567 RepID=A0A9P4KFS1_9PLEO|nr:PR-1-like protein [Didymosphaeria enalia]